MYKKIPEGLWSFGVISFLLLSAIFGVLLPVSSKHHRAALFSDDIKLTQLFESGRLRGGELVSFGTFEAKKAAFTVCVL